MALRQVLAGLTETHGLSRLTWEGETVALRAPPVVRFQDIRAEQPPGGFLQATREGENALLSAITDTVSGAKRMLDLFAGSGTFALPLARGSAVHAVEGDAAMTKALDKAWREAEGLHRITTETRDLFRRPLLPDELDRYDAVVIDPPRAGAEAQTAELAQSKVARIAHVSCNPATFARDAKTLVGAGWQLDWVQVVDQFRWSPHVELAAAFTRPDIRF
jgi:23S rRNA (uracil1939-C5)-methyltransferase